MEPAEIKAYDPNHLYATCAGGPSPCLMRSTDGGVTWSEVDA